jgi:hypothetical protein
MYCCVMDKPQFNAYIDAYNLYYGALEGRPDLKWLDVAGLCKALLPEMELGTVYYFTARVKDRFSGDGAPRRQHAYLRALSAVGIEIVLGVFRKDPRWLRFAGKSSIELIHPKPAPLTGLTGKALDISFESAFPDIPKAHVCKMVEKGSDVNLASYLLRDSFNGHLNNFLVITGDSDLATPVKFSVAAGMAVKVIVPSKIQFADVLAKAASSFSHLDLQLLESNQLPKSVMASKGSPISRPQSWA